MSQRNYKNEATTSEEILINCRHQPVIDKIFDKIDSIFKSFNTFLSAHCGSKHCISEKMNSLKASDSNTSHIDISKRKSSIKNNHFTNGNSKVSIDVTKPELNSIITYKSIPKSTSDSKLPPISSNGNAHAFNTKQEIDEAGTSTSQKFNQIQNENIIFEEDPNYNQLLECFEKFLNHTEENETDEYWKKNNVMETFMCDIENDTRHKNYEPEPFEVFTMTIDEINAIDADVKGDGNIHNTRTEAIKSNLITLNYIKQSNENTLALLEITNTSESLETADEVRDQIEHLEKTIEEEETKLKDIEKLKSEFKEKLRMPILGTNQKYDIESAALSCQKFSDNNSPINNNLEQFWNKLVDFAESNSLSETAIKSLLSCLLIGPAFEVYIDNRDKNLKEIAQILTDRFGEILTISDKLKALHELHRLPGEKLSSVMARCSSLIDATKQSVPREQREVRYELLMTNNLLKLCSCKAKNEIIKERARAARAGYNLPYKSLFLQALAVENLNKEHAHTNNASSFYQDSSRSNYKSIRERRQEALRSNQKQSKSNYKTIKERRQDALISNQTLKHKETEEFGPIVKDINDDDEISESQFYDDNPTSDEEDCTSEFPEYDSF